jgi:hypothetical protein
MSFYGLRRTRGISREDGFGGGGIIPADLDGKECLAEIVGGKERLIVDVGDQESRE